VDAAASGANGTTGRAPYPRVREFKSRCADGDVAADGPSRVVLAPSVGVQACGGSVLSTESVRLEAVSDGDNQSWVTGESTKQAVTHCVRNAGCLFGVFVVKLLVCSHFTLRTRLRMRCASGVPRALISGEGIIGRRAPPRRHNNRGDDACVYAFRIGCLKFESGVKRGFALALGSHGAIQRSHGPFLSSNNHRY
jgi:hypothetical protein